MSSSPAHTNTPKPQAPAGNNAAPSSAPKAPVPVMKGTVVEKVIGKYTVVVDRSKCISAASCVAIAPKVFELDEENLARVISQDGNDDDTKLLAAQSCPTAAITVTDNETGEQVWPPL